MIAIFGEITPPPGVVKWQGAGAGGAVAGLLPFLNAILKLLIVIGGIWAFVNIIFGGYALMNASDDPKKMTTAWAQIYMSLVGLLVIVSSFALAAFFGYLFFGDTRAILQPKIYGPQ